MTAFSLYGPLLQTHLKYSQYQVNAVSTAAEVAMYLPVPLFGWLCDRYKPSWLSLASGLTFGLGYLLAAFVYHSNESVDLMILAFVLIGAGTSCMYLSAVTTCAKNFGRGEHKGIALAMPIAAFGLSGMWQSQIGSHFFLGTSGTMDVDRYFVFLAILLFTSGVIGCAGLEIVDQDQPPASTKLDMETRRFLSDSTMWLLTLGFFLTAGPGETFINNIGGIIYSSYPDLTTIPSYNAPASHVSIIAVSSTLARLATGTLCDYFAPSLESQAIQAPEAASDSSYSSHFYSDTDSSFSDDSDRPRWSISRLYFLLIATISFAIALLALATTLPHEQPRLFPIISVMVGLGYGAIFSLLPIIISAVWGVDNFGTNWGLAVVAPAAGAALWSAIYSTIYQHEIRPSPQDDIRCYGPDCYNATFAGMTVASLLAMVLWGLAWRTWNSRGVPI